MKRVKSLSFFALLAAVVISGLTFGGHTSKANTHGGYQQYYSSYRYYPSRKYYYSSYHYKPSPSFNGYRQHYCVYYPQYPRYVYYYNPYNQVYWGRYDLENKGYSLLAPADRKQNLKDIPEAAFPPAGEMPPIPESSGSTAKMEMPPAPPKI